ncbi:MAG: cysteine-rich protein [Circular genetic element sp.]|nr:MAG: cysteine-rich protein [Circular genetic element sp.]
MLFALAVRWSGSSDHTSIFCSRYSDETIRHLPMDKHSETGLSQLQILLAYGLQVFLMSSKCPKCNAVIGTFTHRHRCKLDSKPRSKKKYVDMTYSEKRRFQSRQGKFFY